MAFFGFRTICRPQLTTIYSVMYAHKACKLASNSEPVFCHEFSFALLGCLGSPECSSLMEVASFQLPLMTKDMFLDPTSSSNICNQGKLLTHLFFSSKLCFMLFCHMRKFKQGWCFISKGNQMRLFVMQNAYCEVLSWICLLQWTIFFTWFTGTKNKLSINER